MANFVDRILYHAPNQGKVENFHVLKLEHGIYKILANATACTVRDRYGEEIQLTQFPNDRAKYLALGNANEITFILADPNGELSVFADVPEPVHSWGCVVEKAGYGPSFRIEDVAGYALLSEVPVKLEYRIDEPANRWEDVPLDLSKPVSKKAKKDGIYGGHFTSRPGQYRLYCSPGKGTIELF